MESLDVGSRHRIQALKEGLAKGTQPQPTKSWAVTKKGFDSLQLLLMTTCSAIVRLGSIPDRLAVPRNKTKCTAQPQPALAVTKKGFDSLQFLLTTTCSAIVRLGSIIDSLAVPRNKTKCTAQPQPTKGLAVTKKGFDSLQLLLIATCPVIVRLGSIPDPICTQEVNILPFKEISSTRKLCYCVVFLAPFSYFIDLQS